jgi:predicted transcriptional regulator
MAKKRERLEIIHDILYVIRARGVNVKPTHILYKSNLSHQMLTEYLDELIGKGFIIEKEDKHGKKTYELTEKGYNYLKDYQVIKSFVDSYGLN